MLRLIACLVLSLTACSSSGSGAPEILSLGTSTMRITESGSVTISAVVTDPDGIADLIGGSLETSDGATTLGAFSSGAEEGAYQMVLPWRMLAQSLDLSFQGERDLDLIAVFFDAGGERASKPVKLTLYCDAPFSQAAAGECVGFDVCKCTHGGCDPAQTCDAFCAARQMDCSTSCTLPGSTMKGAVMVFTSMDKCQSATQPSIPSNGNCAFPLVTTGHAYRCCCSPR